MSFDFMQGSMVALDGEVEPITLGYPRLPDASSLGIELDV
jgi:hypothetical protein